MVIMIIFLLSSILLVIGTIIYLNYKRKNINNNIKQINNKETKEKVKRKSKKQLSDILPLKIKDNIICLGGRYSQIIKLGNIDYNMLSNHEQNSIETILIQTVLAIDYPIQFFSTMEYIDTSNVISLINQNKTNNKNIKTYQNYLTNYLENLMQNRTISIVKNYAVISYDGLYENAICELSRKSASFQGNLLRAKIACEILTEDELYNLIYRELNKNSALNISNLRKGDNLYVGKKQKAK